MWIEAKIELINSKKLDTIGVEETTDVNIFINTFDIFAIREVADNDGMDVEPSTCMVYMRGGESFILKNYSYNALKEIVY